MKNDIGALSIYGHPQQNRSVASVKRKVQQCLNKTMNQILGAIYCRPYWLAWVLLNNVITPRHLATIWSSASKLSGALAKNKGRRVSFSAIYKAHILCMTVRNIRSFSSSTVLYQASLMFKLQNSLNHFMKNKVTLCSHSAQTSVRPPFLGLRLLAGNLLYIVFWKSRVLRVQSFYAISLIQQRLKAIGDLTYRFTAVG